MPLQATCRLFLNYLCDRIVPVNLRVILTYKRPKNFHNRQEYVINYKPLLMKVATPTSETVNMKLNHSPIENNICIESFERVTLGCLEAA